MRPQERGDRKQIRRKKQRRRNGREKKEKIIKREKNQKDKKQRRSTDKFRKNKWRGKRVSEDRFIP